MQETKIIIERKGQLLTFCYKSFDLWIAHHWTLVKCGGILYLKRGTRRNGIYKNIFFHRQLMGFPNGMQVDHINGNGLDNSTKNLRVVTPKQNYRNRRKHAKSASKYIGVTKVTATSSTMKCWRAGIRVDNEHIHIGSYLTEIEAAKARDVAAKKYFGDYANLNFPD